MSRTRIVKGNITKIIGGNYKIYSKDNIENNASKVIQIGKESGVSYGEPGKPPTLSKQIIEIYWTYGDNNIRLMNESKFFVDMNLVVQTKNYNVGEVVDITIKSEDGEPIAEGLSELSLSGKVEKGGKINFREPLRNYTMMIMKEVVTKNI